MECGFYVYKGLLCEICSYDASFTQNVSRFYFLVSSLKFEVRGSGVFSVHHCLPAGRQDCRLGNAATDVRLKCNSREGRKVKIPEGRK